MPPSRASTANPVRSTPRLTSTPRSASLRYVQMSADMVLLLVGWVHSHPYPCSRRLTRGTFEIVRAWGTPSHCGHPRRSRVLHRLLVPPFCELFHELPAERGQVVGAPARHEPVVDDDLA